MDFAEQQRRPTKHLVGFGIVVLMHLLLGWALVSGLARKVVEVITAPIETKIIEEVKPPPPRVGTAARIDVSSCEKPEYTRAALRAEATGTTRIRFTIDATGKVAKAEIEKSSGPTREHRALDAAAVEALGKCPFRPGTDPEGKPIGGAIATVEYVWKIE